MHLQNDMRFSSLCETELITKRKRSILIKNQNEGSQPDDEVSRNRNLSFNQNVQTEVSFKIDASNQNIIRFSNDQRTQYIMDADNYFNPMVDDKNSFSSKNPDLQNIDQPLSPHFQLHQKPIMEFVSPPNLELIGTYAAPSKIHSRQSITNSIDQQINVEN